MSESEYKNFRIPVPPEFESIFSHFYVAENNSEQTITKTLLPNYQVILLFCFGKNALLTTKERTTIPVDKCMVFGPVRQSFEYELPSKTSILVANFKDDAFFRFFGKATIENNLAINPDNLLEENCFTDLWHQLFCLNSPEKQVDYILEFCKPYLQIQDPTSLLLSNFKEENSNPIKTIAEITNQSERNIQLKQKERFGYSSKEISRYNRFLRAIRIIEKEINNQDKIDWFTIINECNYYDQSQLIRDFKHFLNITPTQYLKFQQDICNPKSE